jgi:hypothetical protein
LDGIISPARKALLFNSKPMVKPPQNVVSKKFRNEKRKTFDVHSVKKKKFRFEDVGIVSRKILLQ